MEYREFAPTGFDAPGINLPDRQDWLVAPVSRIRGSSLLSESNFNVVLRDLGGESDTVEVHRFGHWGPEWYEIILVHPSRKAEVDDWERVLEEYPVADDMDYSEREYDACLENWGRYSLDDRVKLCGRWGVSVFSARRTDELPYGFLREDLIDG